MMMRGFAAGLFALCLAVQGAVAQPRFSQRGGTPGDFDFYVLALSWLPAFCELEGDDKDREQCREARGLSFVVHGLWPQYDRGAPSDCRIESSPSRMALEDARVVFGSEGLARYQWRKHGSCSGLNPQAYFTAVKRARDAVKVPPQFETIDQPREMRVMDVERAFINANRGLRTDQIAVTCRRGMIAEVRVCMSKDLREFQSCQEVDRNGCRASTVYVPPLR